MSDNGQTHPVHLRLNHQQHALLERTTATLGLSSLDALVGRAVREYAAANLPGVMDLPADWQAAVPAPPAGDDANGYSPPKREPVFETVLEPSTGKALELRRGQVLRIEQLGHRGQFADFNCFNLHDYKEHFSAGRTRHMHGPHPVPGDYLWSAPPRDRPMLAIVADTAGSSDTLYDRCSAFLYEYHFGAAHHTNCQDIQAEAQREYGLTPDDVHDSFNLFTRSGIDDNDHLWLAHADSTIGAYIELLALFDVLAVPNVCGADVFPTGTLEPQPLRLTVYEADETEIARVEAGSMMRPFLTQRTPEDFKVKHIRTMRRLERDPAYVADFANTPLRSSEIEVRLPEEEAEVFQAILRSGQFGPDEGPALRQIVFQWWGDTLMEGSSHSELTHMNKGKRA